MNERRHEIRILGADKGEGIKKIYISGKITGTNDFRERFAAAEERLKAQGYETINPARINAGLPDGTPWETYMRRCIALLAEADAIYLLNGWRNSRGAHLEVDIAAELNMTMIVQGDEEDDV